MNLFLKKKKRNREIKKYSIFFLIVLSGCIYSPSLIEKEKINPFLNRKDSIFSSSGNINPEETAISPDGKFFVKEMKPYNYGKIGIFLKNGEIFNVINALEEKERNELKGIAWHPESSVIGVVYHKNNKSLIKFYEIFTGKLVREIMLGNYNHYMVFDKSGNKLYISSDGETFEELELRNTDFVNNSGVNLPWINYGWDIGRNPWEREKHGGFSSNKEILLEKFKFFKKTGANVIRVFLFCDLRSGVIFDKFGNCFFDEYVYKDFNTLIEVAEEVGVKIMPVIFDYTIGDGIESENGIPVGEHPEIFYNSEIQKNLLKLFESFFKKIETKNVIYGWDIINEPEHLKIENSKIESFIFSFVNIIRNQRKKESITVGALSQIYIQNYKKFNLDFYQFHYYDSFQNNSPLDLHFYNLSLNRPVVIGELEATDLINKLTKIWENGYRGVLIWHSEKFLETDWKLYKAWVDVH